METKQEAVEHRSHKHTNITKKRGVNLKKKTTQNKPQGQSTLLWKQCNTLNYSLIFSTLLCLSY